MPIRADKKLREVEFFLRHLSGAVDAHVSAGNPEVAEFYFSAFLSAARSVTFTLEAELPDTYTPWSRAWRASLLSEDRDLLARFTEARNRALKRETPTVQASWDESAPQPHLYARVPPEMVFFFDDAPVVTGAHALVGQLTPDSAVERLLPLCRRYYELLSRQLADFASRNT